MQQTFVSSAAMPQIPPTFANEGKNEPAVYHQERDMLPHPDAGAHSIEFGGLDTFSLNVLWKIVTNESNQSALAQYTTVSPQNSIRVLL